MYGPCDHTTSMTRPTSLWTTLALLAVSSAVRGAAPAPQIMNSLSNLPLAFEKNQGQAPHSVDYIARGGGYTVSLSRGNARISLRPAAIDLRLLGARRDAAASPRQPLAGKVNYFLGNDPARWRTDIPTCQRVEYPGVYPGIDLAYYGNQGRMEYDFTVAPGSDPDAIRLAIDGAQKISVDAGGDLVLETDNGAVRFRKPVTYQEVGGKRHEVASRYVLTGANVASFAVGPYDKRESLVIDPQLIYSTYLGGSSFGYGQAVAVGPNGNAFVTGYTDSMDFPTVNPEQAFYPGSSAIFVSKLSRDGSSLVYSTYLAGSVYDSSYSIAVDASDSAYVVGFTESPDFPVKNALYPTLNGPEDAFITKFSPAGNTLVYSTYLGGSSYDSAYGVAVDASNNAYITGGTGSVDFPVTPGAYQTAYNGSCGFVTKLNAAGSALSWSTYFGGNCSADPQAIAVDSTNSVFLTGATIGGLAVTPGAAQTVFGGVEDAFVGELTNTGAALAYLTYLGGSETDYAVAIAVDPAGNAFVTGRTNSKDLPVTASAVQPTLAGGYDGFVAKVNTVGTAWNYVTYLGGTRDDYGYGIAIDSSGNAFVAGSTISADFPQAAAVQPSLAGNPTLLFRTTSTGSTWQASDTGIPDSVESIAIDPASDTHLMAGTIAGLSQTTNGGAHWFNTSSFPGTLVSAIAFSTAGGPVYASAYTSIYSSADDGATWNFAGDAPCGVGSITVDPATPTTLYMSNANSYLLFYPACAAESTDGGVTWTELTGLTFSYAVYGLAIDPKSPSVLYAGTDSGLFKSTNAGQSWTTLNIEGYTNPFVTGVVIDPLQPAVVYAIVYDAIYRSTNSGSTWTQLVSGPEGVSSLAVAASKPSVLYAGTYSNGVYVSSNAGSTWSPTSLTSQQIENIVVDQSKPGVAFAAGLVNPDAFVAKINPTGDKLTYSTYLGGSGYDYAYGVAVNANGNAVVAGIAESPNFPTTAGAFQPATGSDLNSAFVTEIGGQTPACSYSVSPDGYLFYQFGGGLDLTVVSPSGCAWTPTPSVPWITVTSYGGPGEGPLTISVASNSGATRTGSIAIGSASIPIRQAAGGCNYSLSNYDPAFPQTGGPLSIDVMTGTGCEWNVTEVPTWLTVTAGAGGSGNGTVSLQATANPFPNTRSSELTIADFLLFASETGTSGAAARRTVRPPMPHGPRCIPLGAACPAGLRQMR